MCDRAVFMRQRFCDEISRTNHSQGKSTTVLSNSTAAGKPSHTTASDVRPAGWLQLAPARSPLVVPTANDEAVSQHGFLTNFSSTSSTNSSRASSFSSERDVIHG